jgi:hypothetical protein
MCITSGECKTVITIVLTVIAECKSLLIVRILVGLGIVQLLGFLFRTGISWSNRPVGPGDSMGSYPVGAGDSFSFYSVGARVS